MSLFHKKDAAQFHVVFYRRKDNQIFSKKFFDKKLAECFETGIEYNCNYTFLDTVYSSVQVQNIRNGFLFDGDDK